MFRKKQDLRKTVLLKFISRFWQDGSLDLSGFRVQAYPTCPPEILMTSQFIEMSSQPPNILRGQPTSENLLE
jgi:hypothetical protein